MSTNKKITRDKYQLTDRQWAEFRYLVTSKPVYPGEVWKFWDDVAKHFGVDRTTIISNKGTFTALPVGHGQHWCYPSALICKTYNPHTGKLLAGMEEW
jgi:hypothetical protein